MSQYIPNPAPMGGDVEALKLWMYDELQRIARSTAESSDRIKFQVQYVAPGKYDAGDTFHADGVRWNPGTGEGKYRRNALNNAWVKES